jgi:hypothetical protein
MAPVVLFVYKRPQHLLRVLEHLKLNEGAKDTVLYVYAEGPKESADENEIKNIHEVRKIIKTISGFKSVSIKEAATNIGCAKSITNGISEVLSGHENVIILEDDIITHPKFLAYCNKGLELYKDEQQIKQISGFMFPTKRPLPAVLVSNAFFCWGWATWRSAWKHLSMDATKLLEEIKQKDLGHTFNFDGAYPYLTSLEQQSEGKVDAWDICWYASMFLKQGMAISPGISLTQNIGMDGSGTHFTSVSKSATLSLKQPKQLLEEFPSEPVEKKDTRIIISKALENWGEMSFKNKIRSKISRLLK